MEENGKEYFMFNLKTAAAAATIALAGSTAFAQDYFTLQDKIDDQNVVTIDSVTSSMDGMLVAFDYTGGEVGEMLGSAPIVAGANQDTQINLGDALVAGQTERVIVFLMHGDEMDPMNAIASSIYDISDM